MNKIDKAYLLVGGTLLPAYGAVALGKALVKDKMTKNVSMIVFIGGALLGFIYTSKLINIRVQKVFNVE